MMKVIFIFIDGIGIGNKNKAINPIYGTKELVLANLMDNARFHADASLGVKGLPQSATGQTTIFTGVNGALALNRHMSGQPTITLKKIINKINMFGELKKIGLKVASANVYRDEYLTNMLNMKDRRNRPSVTSVMCMAEHIKFRTAEDFVNNNGVYHDITGDILKESGYPVEPVSPQKAARNLYALSRENDFILFEHFVTDIAGHKAELEEAISVVERLDYFLSELTSLMNLEEDVLIITSDHGNLEDISVRTHTMSKVPVIVLGKKTNNIKVQVHSLVDIMPFVLELFKKANQ
jgi:2,3-bisphosphoglycerate-independent phosphoglycerate mutase